MQANATGVLPAPLAKSPYDVRLRVVLACLIPLSAIWFAFFVYAHLDFSGQGNAYTVTCVIDPTLSSEHALQRGRNLRAGPHGGDVDLEVDALVDGGIHILVRQWTEDWQNVELWITEGDGPEPRVKAHVDFAESSGGYIGSFGSLSGVVRLSRSLAAPASEPLLIEYELQGKQRFALKNLKGKVVL